MRADTFTTPLAALALIAVPLSAQTPGDDARPRFSLAAGGDLRGTSNASQLWLATGGIEWMTRVPNLGLRAELTVAWRGTHEERFGPEPIPVDLDCGMACPVVGSISTNARAYGATVSATYTLPLAGPVRPYVLTGVGAFGTRTHVRSALIGLPVPQCPIEMLCASAAPPIRGPSLAVDAVEAHDSRGGAAMHSGVGLAFRLGRAELLVEGRYVLLSSGDRRTLSGAVPLTLGIRF
jgi:hypothetical protein